MNSIKPRSIFLYLNAQGSLALGDAIIHLPFVRALRSWAPTAEITIFPLNGGVKHLMPLYAPHINSALNEVPDPADAKYDWVFDLVGESVQTALKLRRLANRNFFSTAARGLFNLPHFPIYHGKHVLNRHLSLLKQATGFTMTGFWPWPTPKEYCEVAESLLPTGSTYVGIAPGVGNIGRNKRWPLDRYVELARIQAGQGRTPVIFLGPDEAGWEKSFGGIEGVRFPGAENRAAKSAIPSDPTLVVALASRLSAAVTNCCGSGHMFALGSAPLVSLFGPTNYQKFAPFAQKGVCVLPRTPKGKNIEDVNLDDVVFAVDEIIKPFTNRKKLDNRSLQWVSYPQIEMNCPGL